MSADHRRSMLDPERAVEELAREHDALAAMQGADSGRVDRLVQDVGAIRGKVVSIESDMQRVGDGIDELRESMTILNRHSALLELAQAEHAGIRKDLADIDGRLRVVETDLPPLKEARVWMIGGLAVVVLAVVSGLLAHIIRNP